MEGGKEGRMETEREREEGRKEGSDAGRRGNKRSLETERSMWAVWSLPFLSILTWASTEDLSDTVNLLGF